MKRTRRVKRQTHHRRGPAVRIIRWAIPTAFQCSVFLCTADAPYRSVNAQGQTIRNYCEWHANCTGLPMEQP